MTYIYNLENDELVEVEIVVASGKMPLKKEVWCSTSFGTKNVYR